MRSGCSSEPRGVKLFKFNGSYMSVITVSIVGVAESVVVRLSRLCFAEME